MDVARADCANFGGNCTFRLGEWSRGRVGTQQHHTCVKGACACCRYCSFVGFPISLLAITPLRHSRRIVQVPFLYGCKGTKTLRKESCMLIVFVLFNIIHS